MIVLVDDIPVRELSRRVLRDGKGTRTYYRFESDIPVIIRTEDNDRLSDLYSKKVRALFNLDGIDYDKAIESGIPLPASWRGQHIYQVSLKPAPLYSRTRHLLSSAIKHHLPGAL